MLIFGRLNCKDIQLERNCFSSSQRGFTIIELIMVIVILGVLAVFVAPRIINTGDFTARGFHDETLGLLRFAQKTAVAQRRVVCVTLNSTGVTLTIDTGTTPDGTCDAAPVLPSTPRGGSGLAAKVAGATVTSFDFTPLGSTSNITPTPAVGVNRTITITITNSTDIKVEAETGYVHE
ncbi:MAG: type II secretion system GspH family protein [Rhodoferax sp.]|nr:type II secretion system GspH family protein [Rhodoferax sp.]